MKQPNESPESLIATAPLAHTRRHAIASAAATLFYAPEAAPHPRLIGGRGVLLAPRLRIYRDGLIVLSVTRSELGQSTHTALALILAEELEPEWKNLRVETMDLPSAGPTVADMRTAGSDSITSSFNELRILGATVREMLREAAARRWGVHSTDIQVRRGIVSHAASQRWVAFRDIAEEAARLPRPASVPLRNPDEWRWIGTTRPRLDVPNKVDGSAIYGIDVQIPGLLTGAISLAPGLGSTLLRVDPAPALTVRGVIRVVSFADAVVVLADGYWSAAKGLSQLRPQWTPPAQALDDASIGQSLDRALPMAASVPPIGQPEEAMRAASKTIEARYELPYLGHAVMEPMNATAWVRAGHAELWLSTQAQQANQRAVAEVLGISVDKVVIHTTYVGGGFGRRMQTDAAVLAARVSRRVRAPVKLIWSREQDTRHGFYRPRTIVTARAGLDGRGAPAVISVVMAENNVLADYRRRRGMPANFGVVAAVSEGMTGAAYGFPACAFAHADVQLGIPVGPWHSVQFTQNGFCGETIIDELAVLGGVDPLAFRRRYVVDSRAAEVLDKVAQLSGWTGSRPAPGEGFGVALVKSFGSWVAQVARVYVDGKVVRLRHVWCAIDCGTAVYPPGAVQQMEAGILGGVWSAFLGEINIRNGAVVQANFDAMPMVRMAQMPPVTVAIVNSGVALGGVAECGVPPAAPALVNAVSAATGTRIRTLPLARLGFTLGTAAP